MLPLAGLRIVVTRAEHQAEELARPLRDHGALPILLPTIGIAPPANPQPLNNAVAQIDSYDWIIFTSVNGIQALGKQTCRARIATVGAATRDYARRLGWTVSITPETYVAESLIAAFGSDDITGRRILIPSAAVTRDIVRDELARRGAVVEVVEAYRNVTPPDTSFLARAVFQSPLPDWVTFASSSAVENLIRVVETDILRHSKIASIGPITSKTIRQHGLTVTAEPQVHNIPGLVAAIVQAVCLNTA